MPRSEVTHAPPASVEQQSGSSGLVPGLQSAKTTLQLSIDRQGSLTAMHAPTKAFTSAHHNYWLCRQGQWLICISSVTWEQPETQAKSNLCLLLLKHVTIRKSFVIHVSKLLVSLMAVAVLRHYQKQLRGGRLSFRFGLQFIILKKCHMCTAPHIVPNTYTVIHRAVYVNPHVVLYAAPLWSANIILPATCINYLFLFPLQIIS